MHSPEFDELVLLAEAGELEPADLARLAAHEPGCGPCRELRAALGTGRAAAAGAVVSLPEARLDHIARAVLGAAQASRPRAGGVLSRLLAASALAGAVFLAHRAAPREAGGLEADIMRLQNQLAAAEASWALEEPFSDLDADIRRLEESSARLRREVEGT